MPKANSYQNIIMDLVKVPNSSRRRERGAVVAYTVVSALFLFLALGLGVDLSHFYLVKTELQNGADSAALAAATALRLAEDERIANAVQRAVDVLNANKYNFDNREFNAVEKDCAAGDMSDSDVRIEFAVNLDGPYVCQSKVGPEEDDSFSARDVRFVRVKTPTVPVSIFFSWSVLGSSLNLNATATAGLAVETTSPCMIALDPNDNKAFTVTSASDLTALNCEIAVRSNAYDGCNVESNSDVHAQAINICGSDCNVTSDSATTPDAESDSDNCSVADPFAGLTPPPTGPCTYTGEYIVNVKTHVTINPGVYCGGIKLNSEANVTFNPGMYVLNGGGLEIGSKSTANGNGVTFYNTKTSISSFSYKPIKFNSDSSSTTLINLSAPTSGPYKDMLFWQDAGVGSSYDSEKNLFQLNNNVNLTGNLYFPTQPLAVESDTQTTITGMVVARTIAVESGSRLTIDTGDPAGTTSIVRIVLYK